MNCTFLIVGGGIAGVTCAETLAFLEPEESVILISESSLIKTVTNLYAITKTITHFDVVEQNADSLTEKYSNITVMHDKLIELNDIKQNIKTELGKIINYQYICLCMGAEPKLISQADDCPLILGIRDTDSVELLETKLATSEKVVIVGNGGIASELVYKAQNMQIHWVIKDKHISATFVDPGAAEYFQPFLLHSNKCETVLTKRMRYSEEEYRKSGAALGPDWYKNYAIKGSSESSVNIHYECEIKTINMRDNSRHPLEIMLTNNETIECDLVVSATGVLPRTNFKTETQLSLSQDGGILINEHMQTNLKNVFAAGDICHANWPLAKHWFQMKLWTQARQMGCYAAKCMAGIHKNEEVLQDFCFEIFSHSTKLFGQKVILLGLYNGQKLGTNYEILLRMTKGHEYVKFVLENNKLQGAVLIGDTDLEEMSENLILNQLDLSPYGDDILNPDIDIEDYFD